MGTLHAVPWLGARDVRAHNGCGRLRHRRPEYEFTGRERSAAPSAWAKALGEARVGGFAEGPFAVCSVGLPRARPVAPLGYGILCLHDASCTMSVDVLCHNPPGPARGHGLLAQAQTSEPARSRGAIPCAPAGSALLSKRTAVLATSH